MARTRKGAKPPAPAPKPPAPGAGGRAAIIHLKGSRDYAAWLDRLHRATHIPRATLFRLAMAEYAARHGHEPPPET